LFEEEKLEKSHSNFFLLALRFPPALDPRGLLFNSSGFGVVLQVLLLGLWKPQLALHQHH